MKCPNCGNREPKDFAFFYTYIGGQGDYPTIRCTFCDWQRVLTTYSYNLIIARMQEQPAKEATPAADRRAGQVPIIQMAF